MLFYCTIYAVLLYLLFSKNQEKPIFVFFLFVWALIVGLSDMLGGYDRYLYGEIFDHTADLYLAGGKAQDAIQMPGAFPEAGYMIYNYLVAHVTANRYIFILITTLVFYTLICIALLRNTRHYFFAATILFPLFFFFTFTYLREVLGVCIAFFALNFIIERKLIWFLLCAYIIFNIHHSGIIILPAYFIPIYKLRKDFIVIIMLVCLLIGISGIPASWFAAFAEWTGNTKALGYAEDMETYGFRIEYFLEAIFFLAIILSQYDRIPTDRRSLAALNQALIFCGILLIFIQSSNGGRLGWYFLMGLIITVSNLAYSPTRTTPVQNGHTLSATNQTFQLNGWGKVLIMVSVVLFFRILFAWGMLLSPYKTFLTNGHREGDHIYEKFEYDERYDQNKFHR